MSTENTGPEMQGGREVKMIDGVKHVKMACKQGHDWWRASGRGKPPHWCDEHKPAKPEPKPRVKADKAVTAEGKVNGPASKRTPNSEIEAQIAEKEAKDMAQVSGEDKAHAPKSIAELEAEREAEKARLRRKAEQELADIDTAIAEAEKDAAEKSDANLAAMDAINERDPRTHSKQDSTYALAMHACAEVRKLQRRKADLQRTVA